jgi:hypothetical protein
VRGQWREILSAGERGQQENDCEAHGMSLA